jgi:hypothetical protein
VFDVCCLSLTTVPDALVSRLRARTDKHLRKLEALVADVGGGETDADASSETDENLSEGEGAAEDAGGVDDDELDDNGDVDWASVLMKLGYQGGSRRLSVDSESSNSDSFFARCCRQVRPGNKSSSARFQAPYTPFFVLTARFALPILCLVVFFAVIYSTSVTASQKVSDLLDASVATQFLEGEVIDVMSTVSTLYAVFSNAIQDVCA